MLEICNCHVSTWVPPGDWTWFSNKIFAFCLVMFLVVVSLCLQVTWISLCWWHSAPVFLLLWVSFFLSLFFLFELLSQNPSTWMVTEERSQCGWGKCNVLFRVPVIKEWAGVSVLTGSGFGREMPGKFAVHWMPQLCQRNEKCSLSALEWTQYAWPSLLLAYQLP